MQDLFSLQDWRISFLLIDGEIPWENDKVLHGGRWLTHLAGDWNWLCHLQYKDHSFAELKIKTKAGKPKWMEQIV